MRFDKYRFIKDFAATTSDQSKREEKEREAEIIANAIEGKYHYNFYLNIEKLEDVELNSIADSRKGQKRISVNIDDL